MMVQVFGHLLPTGRPGGNSCSWLQPGRIQAGRAIWGLKQWLKKFILSGSLSGSAFHINE